MVSRPRPDRPEDEIERILERLDRLENGAPLVSTSVHNGQTRFVGEDSLKVEGSARVTGLLLVDGTGRVVGVLEVEGDVSVKADGEITVAGSPSLRIGQRDGVARVEFGSATTYIGGVAGGVTMKAGDATVLASGEAAALTNGSNTMGVSDGGSFIGGLATPPSSASNLHYVTIDLDTGQLYVGSGAGDGGADTPPELNEEGYIWPADPAVYGISDDYAEHVARGSAEPGVDVMTPVGAAIYAPANGTIAAVNTSPTGAPGRYVLLRTSEDAWFRMLHLSSVAVSAGQTVTQGTLLGRSGGSGFGSNAYYLPHVHITFWSGPATSMPSFSETEDFEAYMAAQG